MYCFIFFLSVRFVWFYLFWRNKNPLFFSALWLSLKKKLLFLAINLFPNTQTLNLKSKIYFVDAFLHTSFNDGSICNHWNWFVLLSFLLSLVFSISFCPFSMYVLLIRVLWFWFVGNFCLWERFVMWKMRFRKNRNWLVDWLVDWLIDLLFTFWL